MRDSLRLVVVLTLLLAIAWVGYLLLFPSDSHLPLLVQEVEGGVSYTDASGARSVAVPGLILQQSDRLQTEADGRATLSFGDRNTIVLQRATAIHVLGVSAEGVRIELDEGRVEATVRPGHGTVGIANHGREFTGEDAVFAVGVGAQGNLAVEARSGALAVSGVEETAGIAPGQRLVVLPDGRATTNSIPESLLLEVAWPEEAHTREAEVTVRGRTDPGAAVRVGTGGRWSTVIAGEDGRFEASIPILEGFNPLDVVSEDPLGHQATQAGGVHRDSTPPGKTTFEVRY